MKNKKGFEKIGEFLIKKMILKNKKADERLLSLYWIIIMIFVAGTIVTSILIINGSLIDVRKTEADILANRIIDCIIENGYLQEDFSPNFNLASQCNLNLNNKNGINTDYYVEIEVVDIKDINKKIISFSTKDSEDIKTYCKMDKKEKQKNWPKCVRKEVYSLFKDKEVMIEVFTGVKKTEKNVK